MIKYIVYDWLTVINSYNLIGRTKSKLAQIFALLQEAVQLKMEELPDSYTDLEKRILI